MRNLKRALSLTLASVMLLGMMVVGSSAAAGYDDVKETDNVEAIEVLQTVGVMVGDERGFGPDRPVNRAEMAVVMGLLLNLDYNYYSATCPFNDVYDWARGWVGACAANGIVSGRGDGVYDPGATVTAVEGASMLMRALGYFKYASDYADGFEVSTVRQGTTIGIFDGVGSSATEPMTRNQVAQMVLNTLKSGMVQPDGNTLNYFDNNGNIIATGGKINYVYVTSNKTFATAISSTPASSMGSFNDNPIVELGEQLYNGELKLYDKQTDEFGRPSRVWEYKGEEIGTYVKKEILKKEYTAKVTGQTLYELLGKSVVEEYQFRIFIDGIEDREANAATYLGSAYFTKADLYRTNKDAVGATGNGVLTQVYVDTDYRNNGGAQQKPYTVYINIINTYLAKSNEDYDTKNDDVQLRVWRLDNKNTAAAPIFVKSAVKNDVNVDKTNDYRDVYAKGEDFSLVKDVKKDDLYLVQVAQGEIQKIWAPEILDSVTVDAFKLFDHVTTGGQQYDHATTARYDVEAIENWTSLNGALNLKEMTYNVVLDQYGYLIGLERNEKANQYVFLTGLEAGASNLYAKQVDANVIHLDGTMETVKVDLTKSRCGQPGAEHKDHRLTYHNDGANKKNLSQLNTWCTYTVNNNGVYTLTMVPVADTTNPTSTSVKIGQFAQNVDKYNDGPAEKDKEGNNTKSINTKRVSLNAADSSVYVYGNDDTVYLTVSLDKIRVDDDYNTDQQWIVDEVEGVSTGVKNTNLIATELGPDAEGFKYPAAEIYTLYDNKGIVIAAVVIGDDEGASSTYAYVHTSGLEEESYKNTTATKAGDGEWTWLRKVIVNGEIVTLKEVGDNPKYLNDMAQGEWYEVKYNGDGNVRRTDKVTYVNNNVGADGDIAKWIAEVVDVEKSTAEYNTVLLRDITTVNGLTFKNGTLYTTREATKGFSIDPDVKVVLALAGKNGDKKGANWFDSTTDGYKGYTGLEQALREMNAEKSSEFTLASVQVSAVMENGRATSVIINDLNPAPDTKPGGGNKPSVTGMTVTFDRADYVGATFYVNNKAVASDDMTYVGGGLYSFSVSEKDVVEIYGNSIFSNVGKAGSVTIDGVKYTATANKSSVSFTVGDKSITVPKRADIKIAADPASQGNVIDPQFTKVTVVLKQTGKDDVTLNATDAHIVASSETSDAPYSGASCSAGDLYIGFEMPANVTFSTSATADFVVDGRAQAGKTAVAVANKGAAKVVAAQLPAAVAGKTATATEVTLYVTITDTVKPVEVKLPAGYTLLYNDTVNGLTTETLSTGSAQAIKVKFNGLDNTAIKDLKVKYTITGTNSDVTTATLSNGVAVSVGSAGEVAFTDLTGGTFTAKADAEKVVVTITEIIPQTVLGKIDTSAVKDYVTNTNTANTINNGATGHSKDDSLNLVTNKVGGFTLDASIDKLVVTYTLSGVEATDGNKAGLTGSGEIMGGTLTLYETGKTTAASQATFKVKGTEGVVLTITGVTEVTKNTVKLTYAGNTAAVDMTASATNKDTVSKNTGKVEFVVKLPTGAKSATVAYTVKGMAGADASPFTITDATSSTKVTINGTITGDVTVTVGDVTVTKYVVEPGHSAGAQNGLTLNATAVEASVVKDGDNYIVKNSDLLTLLKGYISSGKVGANGKLTITFTGATLSDGRSVVEIPVSANDESSVIDTALAGKYLEKLTGNIGITIACTTT